MDKGNKFIEKEAKDLVRRIARDKIAPAAGERDRNGTFPREAIETLGDAGLLHLTGVASLLFKFFTAVFIATVVF